MEQHILLASICIPGQHCVIISPLINTPLNKARAVTVYLISGEGNLTRTALLTSQAPWHREVEHSLWPQILVPVFHYGILETVILSRPSLA